MVNPKPRSKWMFCFLAVGVLLLLTTVQPSLAAYFVTPNAYWQLEEVDPENDGVIDDMASVNGSCTACPGSGTARIGNGFDFSTGDTQIIFPANAIFDFAAGASFSIELWMKLDGTLPLASRQILIGRDDTSNSTQWWVGVNTDGTAGTDMIDSDGGSGPAASLRGYSNVADNAWHHIVVVRDGSADNIQIYVDGVLEGVQDHSGSLVSTDNSFVSTSDVTLGNLPGSTVYWYGGVLDEIAIYNTALSGAIIAQHANPGAGQFYCNAAPVIDSTEITDATEDTEYSYTATATDPEGHDITWSLTAAPSGMDIDSASGEVTWTPGEGVDSGAVSILATDQYGATASQSFTITVTAVNDAPEITGQVVLTTLEDTPLTIGLTDLTVTDPDNSYPTGFTLTILSGTNYTASGAQITPAADFNGTLTVPVRVNDGDLDSNVFDLAVTVTPVDDSSPPAGDGGGGGGCFITSLY